MANILRPYQAAAAAWGRARRIDSPGKRLLFVAPTGAGKTVIAEELLRDGKLPLALTHTKVLRQQTMRRIPNCMSMTIQGLLPDSPNGNRNRELARRADVVFIDEAHHVASDEWRQILDLFPQAWVIGFTATPKRADGTPLGDVFDLMHVVATYSELIDAGFLVRCDIRRTEIKRKEQKRRKVRPDGVHAYFEHGLRADGSPRPAIYFDSTVAKCEDAVAQFQAKGLRAAVVSWNVSDKERQPLFDAYNRGELDLLASPMALSEGFDAPRAEVCVLRRTCNHLGTYMQIGGRVIRPFAGKERALLIDCTGASEKHGLITDERLYSLDGAGITNIPEPKEKEDSEEEIIRIAAEDVESKYETIRDCYRDRYLELVRQATEEGFKKGWAFFRFQECTGIKVPIVMQSKYKSICPQCRHRLEVGSDFFFQPTDTPGEKPKAFHVDCWFDSLDNTQLDTAQAFELERPAKPARQRTTRAVNFADEFVPFQ